MAADRIEKQFSVAQDHPNAVCNSSVSLVMYYSISCISGQACILCMWSLISQIIGSNFTRMPEGSTERYTRWCNTLTPSQLYTQVYIRMV